MNLSNINIKKGFWYPDSSFKNGWPPESITYPHEYNGEEILNVVCTQTDLPPYQQKKLVDEWCIKFPKTNKVKILWLHSKVPQRLFESVCEMKNLVGLYIKWSGIKDLKSIQKLKSLSYFHLGDSAMIESIKCISKMKNLKWLGLTNINKIQDISPLSKLSQLEGLSLEGSLWITQIVETLQPLEQLVNLKHLSICNLKSKDKTLNPITKLKKLHAFYCADWWDKNEMATIEKNLKK